MPGVIELHLDVTQAVDVYPARLHGAACALLERDGTAHQAQHKPFAVWPVRRGDRAGAVWRLGWLRDTAPALPTVPTVMFGDVSFPVVDHVTDLTTFARLAATGPADFAELHMISPTYFSRDGRDHPLPDPVLIVNSAARRWNVHAPADARVPDGLLGELRSCVHVVEISGRTRRGQVSRTMNQIGFVGTVRIALTRSAGAGARWAFGALMRFAGVAGVGAQTTHGFGAVELTELR